MTITMKPILLVFVCLLSLSVKSQIITTVAGGATGHGGYWGDGGPATAAELGFFGNVAVDSFGNIYIGDTNNQRVRKVNSISGIITTIAGTGIAGYNGDGIPATSAQLNFPGTISFDSKGNIYIVDAGNFRIRRIDIITGYISTYVGNGTNGSNGDGGVATAASIATGYMAFDKSDNLYITCARKIRKITPLGIISTIAGTGLSGVTGEGVHATSTNIGGPRGIATDLNGNVYFGDSTSSIRKITISTGILNRIAGTGNNVWNPYSGDGTIATSCQLSTFGIAVDDTGNIYNSDYGNSRIQKIDLSNMVSTIAGTGIAGYSGDGDIATLAKINFPEYICLDRCNNVYIADFMNKRVRKITYYEDCETQVNIKHEVVSLRFNVYPNPAAKQLMVVAGERMHSVAISNMQGQELLRYAPNATSYTVAIDMLPPGMYMVRVNDVWVGKVVKE
jgi:hypothetical protein